MKSWPPLKLLFQILQHLSENTELFPRATIGNLGSFNIAFQFGYSRLSRDVLKHPQLPTQQVDFRLGLCQLKRQSFQFQACLRGVFSGRIFFSVKFKVLLSNEQTLLKGIFLLYLASSLILPERGRCRPHANLC